MRRTLLLLIAICAGLVLALKAYERHDDSCALRVELQRPLDLRNRADADHLARDLARAETVAKRYRERIRQEPRQSDSVDARRNSATRPDRAYQYCTTVLREEIARIHGVSVDRP